MVSGDGPRRSRRRRHPRRGHPRAESGTACETGTPRALLRSTALRARSGHPGKGFPWTRTCRRSVGGVQGEAQALGRPHAAQGQLRKPGVDSRREGGAGVNS